jgi:hypothetical protein
MKVWADVATGRTAAPSVPLSIDVAPALMPRVIVAGWPGCPAIGLGTSNCPGQINTAKPSNPVTLVDDFVASKIFCAIAERSSASAAEIVKSTHGNSCACMSM